MKKVMLQVAGKIKCSSVNGEGLRYTLFLSGCNFNCDGCHSPHAQDFKYGTKEDVVEIFKDIYKNKKYIDGVSISGGEATLQNDNLVVLLKMLKLFDFNIWLWTGNNIRDIGGLEMIKYVDVIIDGRYQKDNPTTKPHRGSDNQIMWIRNSPNNFVKENEVNIK